MSETTREEAAKGSKRDGMSRLPKDWRQRIFAAVQDRKKTKPGRLAEAVALLWATGCRPAELEAGIQYTVKEGVLVIRIQGAKVGKIDNGEVEADRGMEWRILAVNPKIHEGAQYLYDKVLRERKPQTFKYNKNSIRSRVNELGREITSRLKDPPSISPYSFRHAMASDLKSYDGMSDVARAKVMGHLSVESLESYGRRRRGGGGVCPVVAVRSSAQPRGERTHAPTPPKRPEVTPVRRMRPL